MTYFILTNDYGIIEGWIKKNNSTPCINIFRQSKLFFYIKTNNNMDAINLWLKDKRNIPSGEVWEAAKGRGLDEVGV